MDEGVGVSQVIQEPVSESFAFMCPGDETSDVKQFNGYRALAINTGAVIWFAAVGYAHACTGA
ncbi:hypothetical protein NX059_001245 [Plenodomus lindquistii]|nr:hypothetical protein NX059_001245 [Plenodomus lindquistii]